MEARVEHQGARALTPPPGTVVGIDLGTTNSALAWAEPTGPVQIAQIEQLVAAGETGRRGVLPSFLLFTEAAQRENGSVRLPWDPAPEVVAGVFARDEGALIPARQVASAKSWLSNARVDRTAALLPWGVEGRDRLSPVDASARLLVHLRDAWNMAYAGGDEGRRLERLPVVLTVPASFDEEARELTVNAARAAGLDQLTLLEEPLAALYAWMAAHRREIAERFGDGALLLVCDVGGGTTDFSLIRAGIEDGELAFERTAIGEHLLLGGDNLDLALATALEGRLAPQRLSLLQRQTLRRKCTAAKEQLLSQPDLARVPITILGAGRGVVGGGMSVDLTREDVVSLLRDGFLPATDADDLPARDRRVGLRELGLQYETEPAITRHLASFLTRAARARGEAGLARPTAVLFNGGFFAPALARNGILDALARWFGERPPVLESERPEAAVAIGAAFYGRLRRDPSLSRRLLIRAGSARAYYIGVQTEAAADPAAVCVLARGTNEGSATTLDREFSVLTNRPAAFTLYSTTARTDPVDAVVSLTDEDEAQRHAPLVTTFRYGKRSRQVPLGVRLTAAYTETGTLELWCESRSSEHRWRLAFNLRGLEADPLDDAAAEVEGEGASIVVDAEALARGLERVRAVFSPEAAAPPAPLVGELETTLGHGRQAWPLPVLRAIADVLLAHESGRRTTAAHEVRWLNLAGFCTRPGFGSSLDAWRVSELRKVYAAGLAFPKEIQNQVEWIVLWQRVGAGFSAGQQRELAQRIAGQIGLGGRRTGRPNPQVEREGWRLLASLERLDAGQRAKLGDELMERLRREPRNAAGLWAIGRFGARTPFYGPLNGVVSPPVAERWLEGLLARKELTAEGALAAAQIGALTGDAARDLQPDAAERAAARLEAAGFGSLAERLRTIVPPDRADAARVFGESLPEGLRVERLDRNAS